MAVSADPPGPPADAPSARSELRREREAMVAQQIARRGVSDPRVLTALRVVPRHAFVPDHLRPRAYDDHPLPIPGGQTISQPYIVGLMSELLHLQPGDKVLEIGTGSGYQAAVLAEMGAEVFSIEIVTELAASARQTLAELGYHGVHLRQGDGYRGWPEDAPFAAIVVTAAPPEVPPALLEQLRSGGRLVIPVGRNHQVLKVYTRTADGFHTEEVIPVRFVPMTGEAQQPTPRKDAP